MKLFKRHIDKKREQVELPVEFDWENMQSDIYEKMSEREQAKNPNSNKFITLLFVGAAILLTGSIVSSVFELGAQNQIVESNLVKSKIENHKDSQSLIKAKSEYNASQKLGAKQKNARQEIIKESDFTTDKVRTQEVAIPNQSTSDLSELGVRNEITKLKNEASSNTRLRTNTDKETKWENKQSSLKENLGRIINSKRERKESNTEKGESRIQDTKKGDFLDQNVDNVIATSESENLSNDDLGNYGYNNELNKAKAPQLVQVEQTPNTSEEEVNVEAALEEKVNVKSGRNAINSLAMIEVPQLVSQIDALIYDYQLGTIPAFAITEVIKSEVVNRFTLGLGFGSNVWDLNFSQLLDGSEKSFTEKTRIGIFGSINLEYKLSDRFFIDAGLQYTQLTSRFNKTAISNYREAHTDQLIEEETNVITGSVRQIFGNIELNVTETRRVQHYNSFDLLSIPLVIGYKAGNGRLNPFLGIGATYNLSLKTSGKTEVDGSILDYTDGESSPYKSLTRLHPLVRFGIAYRMRNDIVLSLNGQFQHSLGQWNSTETFIAKPRILDLGFKIGKSF